MTPSTSPKKPDWFSLIENNAPSAQVRKVDKKLPAITGFLAIAIVALGTFFANGSMNLDSSPTSNSAGTVAATQVAGKVEAAKVAGAQSINKIADPTLNGGGNDDDDEYEEEGEEEEEDDDDDDRD